MHTFYTDREKKQGTIVSGHGENLFPWYLIMNETHDKSVTKESCILPTVRIFYTGFSKNDLKRRKCTYNLIQLSKYFVVQYTVTTGEIYRYIYQPVSPNLNITF